MAGLGSAPEALIVNLLEAVGRLAHARDLAQAHAFDLEEEAIRIAQNDLARALLAAGGIGPEPCRPRLQLIEGGRP